MQQVRKAMAGETDGLPAMASAPLSGHTDAVWQVKWVAQGERGERLVSISTDGKVKVWSMKKGLTCNGKEHAVSAFAVHLLSSPPC